MKLIRNNKKMSGTNVGETQEVGTFIYSSRNSGTIHGVCRCRVHWSIRRWLVVRRMYLAPVTEVKSGEKTSTYGSQFGPALIFRFNCTTQLHVFVRESFTYYFHKRYAANKKGAFEVQSRGRTVPIVFENSLWIFSRRNLLVNLSSLTMWKQGASEEESI